MNETFINSDIYTKKVITENYAKVNEIAN